MNWFRSLFPRRLSVTEVAKIMTEATIRSHEKMRREEALFDRYLALTDRPTVKRWMRVIEGAEEHLCDDIDWDHWKQWKREHQ